MLLKKSRFQIEKQNTLVVTYDKLSHKCDLHLEEIERLESKLSKREDRKSTLGKKTSGTRGAVPDASSISYSTVWARFQMNALRTRVNVLELLFYFFNELRVFACVPNYYFFKLIDFGC